MMFEITSNLTPGDLVSFKELYLNDVAKYYPFSTSITADQFVSAHLAGTDPNGYFSKRKTIWRAFSGENTLGFTLVTEKRGGSIKFGPTIIVPEYRGKGIGSGFRVMVEAIYATLGYRKAYSTTNLKNLPGIFYLTKIGYRIELHLKNHYADKSDELVLSKHISTDHNLKGSPSKLDSKTLTTIEEFMYKKMIPCFDEIDQEFFDHLRLTLTNHIKRNELDFSNKQKRLYSDLENGILALTVPKRGYCVKISPFILGENFDANKKMVDQIINDFSSQGFVKFYCITSNCKPTIEQLKELGFFIEGFISEPYKEGCDMMVCSKFV